MRAAFVLLSVFGPLAVAASKLERGLEGDIRGIQDVPVAPTPASFGDGTALYERWSQIGSVPVNRTEGVPRGEKRQPKNLLEARQGDGDPSSGTAGGAAHNSAVSACFDLCQRR